MSAVVVGVDGSDQSIEALRFAAAEARLRHATLRVVHAFDVPTTGSWSAGVIIDREPFERVAHQVVDSALTALGAELEGLDVEQCVDGGGAVPVLIGRASADDLLVVGSRGRGGFKGLLLGSVSQQLVLHAPCPVVVVRGEER